MRGEPITRLPEQPHDGEPGALDQAMALLYRDLHGVAVRVLRDRYGRGLPGATLEPAALVNETYLGLLRQRSGYRNRRHFIAIASRVMLRVLADHERGKKRQKRGGDQLRVTFTGVAEELVTVDTTTIDEFAAALDRLEALDERSAEVARLHFVWGCGLEEVATLLGLSTRTIERDVRFARAWLAEALAEDSA
ncbi:ECF-type sigma factor [Wenzhouxiangella sp. XN24]|uniref:ECF-type sigma factor n=1 Tax=Wenzhouxiangella sp. XN24 TaxID=2713569 RepID=UPI0013E9BC4A|nr:ECF-type sigma factor [Wenzhouxiangella sp. XN24]NGX17038.1 sigma-70 family RNA polymerase sigma factor [Wenzhouxiangella sp. XN24]